tara:strand:+ start:9328 stop:10260 length:933 start_codon:yes stop_codon:yes gene_type:complete
MLKVHLKLLFLVLFINNVFSQVQNEKILFVGHAFGSHSDNDSSLDPILLEFTSSEKNYSKIILGGDFIYDCNDKIEVENFKSFISNNNINFVLGNHENCEEIKSIAKLNFGGINYYEIINQNLLVYLNTTIESEDQYMDTISFLEGILDAYNYNNLLIFSHQVIFSKSDWYLRTNSRTHYEYGNRVFNFIYKKFYEKSLMVYFFTGDIGAYSYTPYSFYHKDKNMNYVATGIGNKDNYKGVNINISDKVDFNFIDLKTSLSEQKDTYSKKWNQLYQLPKLILHKIKKNYKFFLTLFLLFISLYLYNRKKV